MNYIYNNNFNNRVEQLGYGDIPSILEMFKAVSDSLTIETKQFLKPRDHKAMVKHRKTGMPILGIRDPNTATIAATALICYPDRYRTKSDYRRSLGGYPLKQFEKSKVMVLQNVAVRPGFQRRGYTKDIFHAVAGLAVEAGRDDLVAKVHRDNEKSKRAFESVGFSVYSTSISRQNRDVHDYYHADAYDVWNRLTNGNLALYDSHSRLIMK